jgi:hypothetical protein
MMGRLSMPLKRLCRVRRRNVHGVENRMPLEEMARCAIRVRSSLAARPDRDQGFEAGGELSLGAGGQARPVCRLKYSRQTMLANPLGDRRQQVLFQKPDLGNMLAVTRTLLWEIPV